MTEPEQHQQQQPPPQQNLVSTEVTTAYPLPPRFFTLYTDANVAKFPQYQRDRTETDKATDPFSKAVTAATKAIEDGEKDANVKDQHHQMRVFLHPPRPIQGAYSMFGAEHTTDGKKTLRELGIPQLYPDGPLDFKPALKNLVHALPSELLKYLQIVITQPEEFETQKEALWHLLQNIHHVINEFRAHQARDMLSIVMEEELRKKRDMVTRIKEFCLQASEEMRQAQRELLANGDDMTDAMEMDAIAISAATSRATSVDRGGGGDGDGDGDGSLSKPDQTAANPIVQYKELQRRLAAMADSSA
ncbi:Mediator of RNA polymerase II transcription subunit 7 [Geranomyces variabilis]|nr:Mediator of RNA polymerase II transcription subunit 7 [Geranomyces variabilis]